MCDLQYFHKKISLAGSTLSSIFKIKHRIIVYTVENSVNLYSHFNRKKIKFLRIFFYRIKLLRIVSTNSMEFTPTSHFFLKEENTSVWNIHRWNVHTNLNWNFPSKIKFMEFSSLNKTFMIKINGNIDADTIPLNICRKFNSAFT